MQRCTFCQLRSETPLAKVQMRVSGKATLYHTAVKRMCGPCKAKYRGRFRLAR